MSLTSEAHLIGPLDSLPDGAPRRFDLDGTPVCVVRIGERVHAVHDTCTHQDISLSEGEVDTEGCTIECWKHGSEFSLETGEALTLPATKPVAVFEVTVGDDGVVVRVPTGEAS